MASTATATTAARPTLGDGHLTGGADGLASLGGSASRKTSPTGTGNGAPAGMADSIASLPAMPSKTTASGSGASAAQGAFGMGQARRSGTAPVPAPGAGEQVPAPGQAGQGQGQQGQGIGAAQRGFSNPDLARAFGKGANVSFGLGEQPRVSGGYAMAISVASMLRSAMRMAQSASH